MAMPLFHRGKVKEVYEANGKILEFVFTDQISVFDKIIPTTIPRKGETLCRSAVFWFQLAKNDGLPNHFREFIPPNRMRVKKVRIIRDYSKLNDEMTNYLVPLEVISRHYIAGSLWDRIRNGELTAHALGFPKGKRLSYGLELPEPFVEVTTKLEATDRLLSRKEALKVAGLRPEEYEQMMALTLRADRLIASETEERDLIHVDGKKEFGFDEERKLMIVDTFGTADEDRWWDAVAYEKNGECVELSKEFVRQYYRTTGYHRRLMAARRAHKPEPEIGPLPKPMVRRVSKLYIEMFERITGETV